MSMEHVQRGWEHEPANYRVYVLEVKNYLTLIKAMVAFLNLDVFKCLLESHVNFMNPSVFVTQPSAKGKN